MSGKILGVDLGEARTGIAISDSLHIIASPLTLISEKDTEKIIEAIVEVINTNKIETAVIGMPKNMDGTIGFRGELCAAIAEQIKQISGIRIVLWDERLTTKSAHALMNNHNIRGAKRKANIDKVSACIILQSYLDSL